MLKSTTDRYGALPITPHWFSAILVLAALASGFQAASALDPAVKAGFRRFHVPVAILIFLLTAFRIVWWWFVDVKPQPVQRRRVGC